MHFFSIAQIIIFLIGIYCIAKYHDMRKLTALLMATSTGYLFFLMYGFPSFGDIVTMEPVAHHLIEEIHELLNLGGLLVGFACLAYQFEKSGLSRLIAKKIIDRFDDRVAESLILAMIWLLSGFCDNIASALVGTGLMVMIHGRFRLRTILLITVVANAGGAYSVVGDTTTTFLWIKGISQMQLFPALLPSFVCLLMTIFFGIWLKKGDHDHVTFPDEKVCVTWWRFFFILMCIGGAFLCNYKWGYPCLGILPLTLLTAKEWKWKPIREGFSAASFLLPLIVAAGFINLALVIPHDILHSTGMIISTVWISAIIDNIPVTKVLFEANVGHWALLAFCVGVGGSFTYFGSTTSVAVIEGYHNEVQEELKKDRFSNLFVYWIVRGWFMWPVIIISLVAGMFIA
ncbi:MAG: SLC13 family permease [Candidatus Anammoxibacter sp.]